MAHQRKGGIHDICSIFMGTFGRYRLTGLLHQNICGARRRKAISFLVAFYFSPPARASLLSIFLA
jgi:hypothetical protein